MSTRCCCSRTRISASAGSSRRCAASACSRCASPSRRRVRRRRHRSRALRDGDGWLPERAEDLHQRRAVLGLLRGLRRHRPGEGAKGISLFIVDKGMPGFTIGRDQPMMGLAGTSHVELFFDDVRLGLVPARPGRAAGSITRSRRSGRIHPRADRRARRRQGDPHPRHDDRVCRRAPPVRQADRRAAADPAIARRRADRNHPARLLLPQAAAEIDQAATRASASRW